MTALKLTGVLAVSLAMAACRAEPPAANVSQVAGRHSVSGLVLVPLEISGRGRVHRFTVEVARTGEEQQQGLMFRESLADDAGMIFPFPTPRPASFWMRNTLIPLDMIFIRADGTIARVASRTVPLDESPVQSGEPVVAVLELRGGRAGELGIREGDRVSWPG